MKETKAVLSKVCHLIDNKKGDGLLVLSISDLSSFSDFFIICHGFNTKQNQTICDEILTRLKKEDRLLPSHVEGYPQGEWILIDYLEFVVHIFSARAREFYQLEKLWSDGIRLEPKALEL